MSSIISSTMTSTTHVEDMMSTLCRAPVTGSISSRRRSSMSSSMSSTRSSSSSSTGSSMRRSSNSRRSSSGTTTATTTAFVPQAASRRLRADDSLRERQSRPFQAYVYIYSYVYILICAHMSTFICMQMYTARSLFSAMGVHRREVHCVWLLLRLVGRGRRRRGTAEDRAVIFIITSDY